MCHYWKKRLLIALPVISAVLTSSIVAPVLITLKTTDDNAANKDAVYDVKTNATKSFGWQGIDITIGNLNNEEITFDYSVPSDDIDVTLIKDEQTEKTYHFQYNKEINDRQAFKINIFLNGKKIKTVDHVALADNLNNNVVQKNISFNYNDFPNLAEIKQKVDKYANYLINKISNLTYPKWIAEKVLTDFKVIDLLYLVRENIANDQNASFIFNDLNQLFSTFIGSEFTDKIFNNAMSTLTISAIKPLLSDKIYDKIADLISTNLGIDVNVPTLINNLPQTTPLNLITFKDVLFAFQDTNQLLTLLGNVVDKIGIDRNLSLQAISELFNFDLDEVVQPIMDTHINQIPGMPETMFLNTKNKIEQGKVDTGGARFSDFRYDQDGVYAKIEYKMILWISLGECKLIDFNEPVKNAGQEVEIEGIKFSGLMEVDPVKEMKEMTVQDQINSLYGIEQLRAGAAKDMLGVYVNGYSVGNTITSDLITPLISSLEITPEAFDFIMDFLPQDLKDIKIDDFISNKADLSKYESIFQIFGVDLNTLVSSALPSDLVSIFSIIKEMTFEKFIKFLSTFTSSLTSAVKNIDLTTWDKYEIDYEYALNKIYKANAALIDKYPNLSIQNINYDSKQITVLDKLTNETIVVSYKVS